MDLLAETGSSWFCSAAHAVANVGFEYTTCGSATSRYAIGLATMAVVAMLCLTAAWRVSRS